MVWPCSCRVSSEQNQGGRPWMISWSAVLSEPTASVIQVILLYFFHVFVGLWSCIVFAPWCIYISRWWFMCFFHSYLRISPNLTHVFFQFGVSTTPQEVAPHLQGGPLSTSYNWSEITLHLIWAYLVYNMSTTHVTRWAPGSSTHWSYNFYK